MNPGTLARALTVAQDAIGEALTMAQQHDATTGFYRDVSPYDLAQVIRPALYEIQRTLAQWERANAPPPKQPALL